MFCCSVSTQSVFLLSAKRARFGNFFTTVSFFRVELDLNGFFDSACISMGVLIMTNIFQHHQLYDKLSAKRRPLYAPNIQPLPVLSTNSPAASATKSVHRRSWKTNARENEIARKRRTFDPLIYYRIYATH